MISRCGGCPGGKLAAACHVAAFAGRGRAGRGALRDGAMTGLSCGRGAGRCRNRCRGSGCCRARTAGHAHEVCVGQRGGHIVVALEQLAHGRDLRFQRQGDLHGAAFEQHERTSRVGRRGRAGSRFPQRRPCTSGRAGNCPNCALAHSWCVSLRHRSDQGRYRESAGGSSPARSLEGGGVR